MTEPRPTSARSTASRPGCPADFVHPTQVELPFGHHLRPIRADDVDLDMVAVMGSRSGSGASTARPGAGHPRTMTHEQDREDLARHADEMQTHESFNYALFDADETALLGCVYIDPPEKPGADAEISWWVVDECVGTDLEAALDELVPRWIADDWPSSSRATSAATSPGRSGSPCPGSTDQGQIAVSRSSCPTSPALTSFTSTTADRVPPSLVQASVANPGRPPLWPRTRPHGVFCNPTPSP